MNSNNIFFYSEKCKDSIRMKDMLKAEEIFDKFTSVCIDNLKSVPASIKMTPTLVLSKINVPLEGSSAFQWLANFRQLRLNYHMNKQNGKNNDPLEFIEKEMTGFSDMFSYLLTDDAQPQSFSTFLTEQKIFAPIISVSKTKTKDESAKYEINHKKNYDELLKRRTEQDKLNKKQLEDAKKNPSLYFSQNKPEPVMTQAPVHQLAVQKTPQLQQQPQIQQLPTQKQQPQPQQLQPQQLQQQQKRMTLEQLSQVKQQSIQQQQLFNPLASTKQINALQTVNVLDTNQYKTSKNLCDRQFTKY